MSLTVTTAAAVAARAVAAQMEGDGHALARAFSPLTAPGATPQDTFLVGVALAATIVGSAGLEPLPAGRSYGVRAAIGDQDVTPEEMPPPLIAAGQLVAAIANRDKAGAAAVWQDVLNVGGRLLGDVFLQLVVLTVATLEAEEEVRRSSVLAAFRDAEEPEDAIDTTKVRAEREWFL